MRWRSVEKVPGSRPAYCNHDLWLAFNCTVQVELKECCIAGIEELSNGEKFSLVIRSHLFIGIYFVNKGT